jgi:two-component system response regulator CpxR
MSSPRPALILIVDDDAELTRMLQRFLAGEGFSAIHAGSGSEALQLLLQRAIDLIVLDVMLPGMDGFEVLRQVRERYDTPILMLTARGDDADRILGLEGGADDYLSKPFNPRELVARIGAIFRRMERRETASRPPIHLGPLTLDPTRLGVLMGGEPIRLTTAEFMVLEALVSAAGRMQTRARLTEIALGRPLEACDRSIDTHVSNLRRKLHLGPGARLEIRSVRGVGYLLTGHPS